MTDVILQYQLKSPSASFPRTFETVTLLFDMTVFFNIGSIDKVC